MTAPAGYREWDADKSAPSEAPSGYTEYKPDPPPERDWLETTGNAAKMTAYGAGAGAGMFALKGLLRKAFPGMPGMATTSALKRIDAAIKKSDTKSGLKPMFSSYMREVSSSDKPITFADFMAQQPGHANANAIIKDMIANSGNIPSIEDKLTGRAAQTKGRVLDDIASALGVPKQSVVMGKDELIKARKEKAQPLYDAAFKDDAPIKDSRFYSLFEAPAARKALSAAVTNAENRLQPMDVRSAAAPGRKDWWKRMQTDDIPEGLFLDDESGGLRRYIAPNMRNADAVQKALRQKMESAMVEDKTTGYMKHTEESRALDELHKKFMQSMYDTAPNDSYRQARTAYAGDSALLDAHKVGSELLKMTPDEARKAIKDMTPDQREALASGFYGSMQDMNHQKFLRELVARPERYPERREVLSTVFRDPQRLDQFMANLRGEEAMTDSAATFGNAPPSKDPGPRLPWMRISDSPVGSGEASARVAAYLQPHLGWPSTRASRAGTDMLFRDPTFNNRSVSHPDWDKVNDTPLSAFDRLKQGAKYSGAGAGGGLGIYGASQIPWGTAPYADAPQ